MAFTDITTNLEFSDAESAWDSWMYTNSPPWHPGLNVNETRNVSGARNAVKDLLDVVRKIEQLQTLEVPNFADPENPSWVSMELVGTNVNGAFISDMVDYLDGAPVVEVALEHYQSLMALLRSMGMDVRMGPTADNDFAAAMLAGQTGALSMNVHNVVDPTDTGNGFEIDHEHKVSVHIPTGTFIVECDGRPQDPEQVVQKWHEAKTIARLTGEEDELLAYARAYAASQRTGQAQRVIQSRV
jgi:hypothetical protein